MSLKDPRVTVLLPVYNGEKYLREAIESILDQTFHDFEFLIIDDCSTDSSIKIIRSFKDERICLARNKKNLKLAKTLNKGIRLARGEYIARMDSDDISLPDRLSEQIRYMDKNPGIGASGSWVELIGENAGKIWDFVPGDPDTLKCLQLFSNFIFHPTTIIRKSLIKKYGLFYDEDFSTSQDYDLWCRISQYASLSNLEKVLLYYREHPEKISQTSIKGQTENANLIRKKQVLRFNSKISRNEFEIHNKIGLWDFIPAKGFLIESSKWLIKLGGLNKKKLIYPEPAFFKGSICQVV